MYGLNVGIAVTTTSASAASVTATATGEAGKQIQVLGFDGSSNDQSIKLELKFGSTVKATMHSATDAATGRQYNEDGPVAATGETVTVVTTPASSGQCDANILYRIIN